MSRSHFVRTISDLFRGAGIGAHGVDTNQSMVQECHDRGLTADCDDAVAYLQRFPDASPATGATAGLE